MNNPAKRGFIRRHQLTEMGYHDMEAPISSAELQARLRAGEKKSAWKMVKRNFDLYIYLIPIVIYFIIFDIIPMAGLVVAFKNYNIFLGIFRSPWVGFANFEFFLTKLPMFWLWVRNTIMLNILGLIFGFPAPIILALLLNEIRVKWFKRTSQSLLYLPHFLSWVILGGMIYQILSPRYGIVNEILRKLGLVGPEGFYFMASEQWWIAVYIGSGIWQGAGWGTILYLAALTAIDPALYEAAKIDGAGRWKQMWHITLPGIAPTVAVLLIFAIGGMVSSNFEQAFALRNPLVNSVGTVLSIGIYELGIVQGAFSVTTAIGMVQSIISMLLILGANIVVRKLGHEGLW